MGCCSSNETTRPRTGKDGKPYQDASGAENSKNNNSTLTNTTGGQNNNNNSGGTGDSSKNNNNNTTTTTIGKDGSFSGAGTNNSLKSPRKDLSGGKENNKNDEENSDQEDLDSDRASVSSRKSTVSVSSTRSSKVVTSTGTSIPKSQDALLSMQRTKTGGTDASSPSKTSARGGGTTNNNNNGLVATTSGEAQNNYLSEATLDAAKNEMNQFIYGDYSVDPLDAIEQRNARFLGGTGGGHKNSQKGGKHLTGNNVASATGGIQFVLNDFVIRTMDEEMLDAADFKGTSAKPGEQFYGDRPLRNASCTCILGHGARVKAIAVAPDEETFVSSSVEDNDILQQFVSGTGELFYFTGHGAAIVSLSFSRDGHYFASTSRDASIAVWDSQQGTVHKRVRWLDADCGGGGSIPIANAFSWNGQYICAGYQDRVCRVWDLDKNTVVTHFTEHEGIVICVSCHPTELLCASGGADRMVFLWHLETGSVAFRCAGHDNAVISVNFTPNGESLISSDDKSCRIWEVSTGKLTLTVNVSSIVPSLQLANNTMTNTANNNNTSTVNNNKDGDKSVPSLGNTTTPGLMAKGEQQQNNKEGSASAATGDGNNLPGFTGTSGDKESSAIHNPLGGTHTFGSTHLKEMAQQARINNYLNRLPESLRQALNGRNSLATAKKAFQSTAAISQRIAFTVSCPCPGQFSTGYFAVASTAKSVHIISMTTGREETSFAAKAPVFALTCGRENVLMFGDTFGNLYVAQLK